MQNIKMDIKGILRNLDSELHEINKELNKPALIRLSADFREILDVIQYFESSIDTLHTQNEMMRDIFRNTIRDIIDVQEKFADGSITKEQLNTELDRLREVDLLKNNKGFFGKLFDSIENSISPKTLYLITIVSIIVLLFLFYPTASKTLIKDIKDSEIISVIKEVKDLTKEDK